MVPLLVHFLFSWSPTSAGRFDRSKWPQPPGFQVGSTSFEVSGSHGDAFAFASPLSLGEPVVVDSDESVWHLPERPLLPSLVSVNLSSPGFSMYFGQGFALDFTDERSPRLSADEVTVDAPNPTPPSIWTLVSFATPQPPVLLVFDTSVQTVVTRSSTGWRISTLTPYAGWVNVRLPLGQFPLGTDVQSVGSAAKLVSSQPDLWLSFPAHLTGLATRDTDTGINCSWTYDRPGALVPDGLFFAQRAGDPVEISTSCSFTQTELDQGPQIFNDTRKLEISIPVRRFPAGAPLFAGGDKGTDALFWPDTGPPAWPRSETLDNECRKVLKTVDSFLWLPTSLDDKQARLAQWASVYGSGSQDLWIRKQAAVLNAGLTGQPNFAEYRSARGATADHLPEDDFIELRKALYAKDGGRLADVMPSPIRLDSGTRVAVAKQGQDYRLSWTSRRDGEKVVLRAPWPFEVDEAKNIGAALPTGGKSGFQMTFQSSGVGDCGFLLKLPKGQQLPELKPLSPH